MEHAELTPNSFKIRAYQSPDCFHRHKCNQCEYIWEHSDYNIGDAEAHTCPRCGRKEQWSKYCGPEAPDPVIMTVSEFKKATTALKISILIQFTVFVAAVITLVIVFVTMKDTDSLFFSLLKVLALILLSILMRTGYRWKRRELKQLQTITTVVPDPS